MIHTNLEIFTIIGLVVSLIALAMASRANLIAKRSLKVQRKQHELNKIDIATRQNPKIQISNETFLSQLQIEKKPLSHDSPIEINHYYSSLISNKGESTAKVESITIEICPASSPLAEPKCGIGVAISGPIYLASGEAIALEKTITPETISVARLFFSNHQGVLVFVLIIKYQDYLGKTLVRRAEIYRMADYGMIVSKGNYDAASGIPRTYLLTPSEGILT